MEKNNQPGTGFEDMDINADADIPGSNHLSNQPEEQGEFVKVSEELEEQKDKFIRLVAEFENFKRRTAKERVELIQTAGREVIVSLLEVLDDCERAEKQMDQTDDIKIVREGTKLVFNKLRTILQQKGLKPMQSISMDFDIDKHEAITQVEVAPEQKGKVVDELEKGYLLNDKIIRFAKVVVGK